MLVVLLYLILLTFVNSLHEGMEKGYTPSREIQSAVSTALQLVRTILKSLQKLLSLGARCCHFTILKSLQKLLSKLLWNNTQKSAKIAIFRGEVLSFHNTQKSAKIAI